MFKKKPPVDENALNEVRAEMEFVRKFALDSKTDSGKNLIQLLDDSIQDTVKEFVTKEVDKFDTDAKMILFLASCRSKLQTLMAIKNLYTNSEKRMAELNRELQEILPKEE